MKLSYKIFGLDFTLMVQDLVTVDPDAAKFIAISLHMSDESTYTKRKSFSIAI